MTRDTEPAMLTTPVTGDPLSLTPQPVKRPGDILTPREVATEYRLAERTLANWRALKQGPRYLKFGKRAVRYRRTDLEAFIAGGADEGKAA